MNSPDKGFVEAEDQPNGYYSQGNAYPAKQRREISHGCEGKDKFQQRVKVHEPILEEFFQCFICLSNSINNGPAVIILVPFHRQNQRLVIGLHQKISSKRKGKRSFEHARRTMY